MNFIRKIGLLLIVLTIVTFSLYSAGQQEVKADEKPTLCLVQTIKGHPVHHIVQLGFLEKAKELGYKAEIVGTEDFNDAETIALGEAALAKGNKGFMVWAHLPAYYPLIKKIHANGGKTVVAHFNIPEGEAVGLDSVMSADPYTYGQECAKAIGEKLAGKAGSVVVSQGSFNTGENSAAAGFIDYMKLNYPKLKVLVPIEEGFDPPIAISRAVAVIQANPDLVAAFSTTGGGPQTWAGAMDQTGKNDLVVIGMDYTEQNLDLVKSGKIFAIVAQPLYQEAVEAVITLDKLFKGEPVPYYTPLEAPIVTAAEADQYSAILERVKNFDFTKY